MVDNSKQIFIFLSYGSPKWPIFKVKNFFEAKGYKVFILSSSITKWSNYILEVISEIRKSKYVFIWNGQDMGCEWIKKICDIENKPVIFFEWGFFPQRENFHFDKKGIIGDSSLCGDISWVTDEIINRFHDFRKIFIKKLNFKWEPNNAVVVPLQIEFDSAILFHSPIKFMDELIEYTCKKFIDMDVWVVKHPRHLKQKITVTGRWIEKSGTLISIAKNAKLVFGLTSTSLIESCLLGIPTIAIGNCPIKYHDKEIDKLLSAYYYRQIPMDVDDISPWLKDMEVEI